MCFLLRVLPVDLRGAAGIYTNRGKVDGVCGANQDDVRKGRAQSLLRTCTPIVQEAPEARAPAPAPVASARILRNINMQIVNKIASHGEVEGSRAHRAGMSAKALTSETPGRIIPSRLSPLAWPMPASHFSARRILTPNQPREW